MFFTDYCQLIMGDVEFEPLHGDIEDEEEAGFVIGGRKRDTPGENFVFTLKSAMLMLQFICSDVVILSSQQSVLFYP